MVARLSAGCAGDCQSSITPVSDPEELVARYHDAVPDDVPVLDAIGSFATASGLGYIDLRGEFFQDLGGNGGRGGTRTLLK